MGVVGAAEVLARVVGHDLGVLRKVVWTDHVVHGRRIHGDPNIHHVIDRRDQLVFVRVDETAHKVLRARE